MGRKADAVSMFCSPTFSWDMKVSRDEVRESTPPISEMTYSAIKYVIDGVSHLDLTI